MAVPSESAAGRDVVLQRTSGIATGSWNEWQAEVIALVRLEFSALFHGVHCDDFDWDAWRPLFDHGHAPEHAVKEAFSQVERK